jgi:hypothetical protein
LQGDGEPTVVGSGDGSSYRAKFSKEKVTRPDREQIFRVSGPNGSSLEDILALDDESYRREPSLGVALASGSWSLTGPGLGCVRC